MLIPILQLKMTWSYANIPDLHLLLHLIEIIAVN